MCPRIPQDHLDEMLAKMGEAVFEQEYFCRFLLGDRQVFSVGAIDSIVAGAEEREESLGWKVPEHAQTLESRSVSTLASSATMPRLPANNHHR